MSWNSNHGLGPLLRAHRERQGLTLEALAESIKVKRSLLQDLERNDVSRWPPGIFGRALVREYAKSIGLPTDDVVRQFLELLSPEERYDPALARGDAAIDDAAPELRLTLGDVAVPTSHPIAQRLVGAACELVFVLATGCLVALVTGLPIWTSNAIVALIWLPTAAVLCGHEVLYRILRVDRWRVFSMNPRTSLGATNRSGSTLTLDSMFQRVDPGGPTQNAEATRSLLGRSVMVGGVRRHRQSSRHGNHEHVAGQHKSRPADGHTPPAAIGLMEGDDCVDHQQRSAGQRHSGIEPLDIQ